MFFVAIMGCPISGVSGISSGGCSFWYELFLEVILMLAVSGVKYFCWLQRLSGVLGRGFDVLL